MPQDRYYLDTPLQADHSYTLTEGERHHLVNVSKAKPGSSLELVNGRGQLAHGTVTSIQKKTATILVHEVLTDTRPKPPILLCLAMPRKSHLEWIIEKATELDVTEIWLFPGMQSEITHLSPALLHRLTQLTIAAMKQSGRLDLPPVLFKPPLLQWPKVDGTLLFGDTSSEAPYLWEVAWPNPLPLPVVLFTGPERGFSAQEQAFLSETLGARGVRFHPNTLRAETAPLVGLSLIQTIIAK